MSNHITTRTPTQERRPRRGRHEEDQPHDEQDSEQKERRTPQTTSYPRQRVPPTSHTTADDGGQRGRTRPTRAQGDEGTSTDQEKMPRRTPTRRRLGTQKARTQNPAPHRGGAPKRTRQYEQSREHRQRQHHTPSTTPCIHGEEDKRTQEETRDERSQEQTSTQEQRPHRGRPKEHELDDEQDREQR